MICYTITHTVILYIYIGLKRELIAYQETLSTNDSVQNDTVDNQDTVMRTLTICKGKCPDLEKGTYHKLMNYAWHTQKIETCMQK